jgi:O-antigen ligase
MIYRFTQIAFVVLVFSLGFMQPFLFLFGQRIHFTDFIFLLVFGLWIASLIFKQTVFRGSRFYLPLAIYLFAFVCSTIFSVNPKLSAVKLLGEIYLIGLAVLSFNLIDTVEKLKKVFQVWLSATAIAGFVSLLTFVLFYIDRDNSLLLSTLSHYGTLPPGNYPRITATFINPNMLCNYLSISFLILFASIKLKWINHTLTLVLLVLLSFASAFTISPNLGGIFLCAGLWFWLIFKEKKKLNFARLFLVGGILSALLFFFATVVTPIPTETSPFYINVPLLEKRLDPSSRVLAWQSSLQTLMGNPIFGKGVGTDAAHAKYLNPSGRMETLLDAHQMWLNVAGQTGVFGFFALCYLCVFLFRRAIDFSFASQKFILQTALGIAFLSAFLYQGLTGSYEDARHLWVLIGLLASVSENDFPKTAKND